MRISSTLDDLKLRDWSRVGGPLILMYCVVVQACRSSWCSYCRNVKMSANKLTCARLPSTSYSDWRWRQTTVTSSPGPPPGFSNRDSPRNSRGGRQR